MQGPRIVRRWSSAFAVAALAASPIAALPIASAAGSTDVAGSEAPTPRAACGPGSEPETAAQGRVPSADVASGRAARGYTCNTVEVGHFGTTGGFKVFHYVDHAGHECAFYDSTLLFPTDVVTQGAHGPGVYVLDMANPAHPVLSATLVTPAMLTPHESLSLNAKRGLLAADMGNPLASLGIVDIYDVSTDCRHPVLQSSSPLGLLGHEGNFAPDGNTFYVSSTVGHTLTAVDVSNPVVPRILWTTLNYIVHGMNISDDGNRMYFADLGGSSFGALKPPGPATSGLTILDTTQVQQRATGVPQVPEITHLTWPTVSIPQNAIPVTIAGHKYLVEFDEFARNLGSYDPSGPVGAGRIIDIADDHNPTVISNLRLEVNTPKERAGPQQNDSGATSGLQGYAAHYCAVPQRTDPGIVACSFIMSGLRVFDIRDPYHPREIAYFNHPVEGSADSAFAMSAPAFVPERGEIWYADGNNGFFAVRVTNGVWPFRANAATTVGRAGQPTASGAAPTPAATVAGARATRLPATGGRLPIALGLGWVGVAFSGRRVSRRGPGRRRSLRHPRGR